jgi:hypothetical protein
MLHPAVSDIKTKDYDFNDLMTKTFSFFFKNFWELTLPYIVLVILMAVPVILFLKSPFLATFIGMIQNPSTASPWIFISEGLKWWGGIILIGILFQVLYTLYLTRRINALIMGEGETIGKSLSKSFSLYLGALGTFLFTGLMIMVSSFFCLLPALFLSIGLCLVVPAVAIDGRMFIKGISDSFKFINRRYWRSFGFLFVMYLALSMAASTVIGMAYIPLIVKMVIKGVGKGYGDLSNAAGLMHFYKAFFTDPFFIFLMVIAFAASAIMAGIFMASITIMYVNFRDTQPGQPVKKAEEVKAV